MAESILPIGVHELLSGVSVETSRLEFKGAWDADVVGPQVIKTICAFANDLQNLNGGYIILGVAEANGVAVRPAQGLSADIIDSAVKWIRGHCKQIDPEYTPVFSPEVIDETPVLVIWAPASDTRPHQAPVPKDLKRKAYFVRLGSESVEAKHEILTQLMQQTARVPYDDRRAFDARLEDIRESRVREFLHDVRSALVDATDALYLYRAMHLTRPVNGHFAPRNVALLFFSDDPEVWMRGARIEVVQFADDAGGNSQEEVVFRGPLHEQVRRCLDYLQTLSTSHLSKVEDHAETRGWVSYPTLAIREAIVNAVYHRSYEESVEPVKVYLYPDRMEVISYPGPVQGVNASDFSSGKPMPPVPARNRRIGELLKELRLAEGRGTGLPKIFRSMEANGSPQPSFDFDEGRSYFRTTLPAHPEFIAISALRDAAYLKATGDESGAVRRLREAYKARPDSALLAQELIRLYAAQHKLEEARQVYDLFSSASRGYPSVAGAMVDALLDANQQDSARAILDKIPSVMSTEELFATAILERRARRQKQAHTLFLKAGQEVLQNSQAAHEFAQTKMALARELAKNATPGVNAELTARTQLLREAENLLERVVQLDASPLRHAWAWLDLARVRRDLGKPQQEVFDAADRAAILGHREPRLLEFIEQLRERQD